MFSKGKSHVFTYRHGTKQRSALKAKINNLLSAEGINLKREALSSNKALERCWTCLCLR